jgi:hypothetical protein
MRTRQAVKRDGGRQNGPRAAPGAEAAAPRDRTSVPFQDRGEQASAALNSPAAKGESSVNSLRQSAGQVRPALWPAHASEVAFGEPRKTGPAPRPTVHFEGTGAPPSEAEAARAAAAFRQRSSLFHNDEGAATDSIPDFAMELGSMALPFAPSIAAQMAPRFAQRLLPRLLLPEYNGTTSGVLFTNEGRVVRLQSGAPNPAYRNYPPAKHVEGKAAIWLRENDSSGGVLFHNHPGGTCGLCDRQTRTVLPENVKLRIVPPANAVALRKLAQTDLVPYVGNSNIPKPPRPAR